MPKIEKRSAFNRAMATTNKWMMAYAKFMCNLSNKGRLKIYRKLAALLRNRFSLMNALDMIYNGIDTPHRLARNAAVAPVDRTWLATELNEQEDFKI